MLCDSCHQNPAQIHLEKDINGQKTVQNLCPSCYHKAHEAADPFHMFHEVFGQNPQNSLLQTLLNPGFSSPSPSPTRPAKACPECGTSWEDFRQTGLFGCALCYDTFADALPELARKIHGQAAHIGSSPQEEPAPANDPSDEGEASQVDQLKTRLQQAIADEAYEEAALLRDQIKALEQEGEDHA